MVDLLAEQTALWQQVEAVAREQFRRAAVQEIRTPILEAMACVTPVISRTGSGTEEAAGDAVILVDTMCILIRQLSPWPKSLAANP